MPILVQCTERSELILSGQQICLWPGSPETQCSVRSTPILQDQRETGKQIRLPEFRADPGPPALRIISARAGRDARFCPAPARPARLISSGTLTETAPAARHCVVGKAGGGGTGHHPPQSRTPSMVIDVGKVGGQNKSCVCLWRGAEGLRSSACVGSPA